MPEDTKEQMLEKQEKLSFLAADFVYMAKRFSKIIISEASVPNHQKTVKKCNVGGRAGGIKYIYNGFVYSCFVPMNNTLTNDAVVFFSSYRQTLRKYMVAISLP